VTKGDDSMLKSIDISTSGLIAQRHRMNTLAGNISNTNTTRDADGNVAPFQRRFVTFAADSDSPESEPGGVGVRFRVEIDTETQPRSVLDPGHPDADPDSFVFYPNINIIKEFVDAMGASRAYESNIAAIEMSKQMANQGSRILA
jgi:flagellar basal-body rod protein FlgC